MRTAEEVLKETWDNYKGYHTSIDCLTTAMKQYAKEALEESAEKVKGDKITNVFEILQLIYELK